MSYRNQFASRLSKFLRLNGDRVISGTSKLTLSTSALCMLNDLFDNVLFASDGAQALFIRNTKHTEELFEDVKFLFDFVRKMSSLKIFHDMQTLRGGVDLSNFVGLNILELHKVPMHLVIGLNALCPQLTVLICHRSICFLKEIFGNAEVESNLREIWTGLRELNIAYNYLEGFDQSFGVLPNVEYISASHNNLKHVDEIQMLERLVFLNLSYNLLEHIPLLSNSCSYTLKVLLMRNNILDDLEGLEMLPLLEELDVSYNCISEHSALRSLKHLRLLKSLNLAGNPIYFHKRHRLLTTRFLHTSVLSKGIWLNQKFMATEDALTTMRKTQNSSDFYMQNSSTHQTAINVIIEDVENNRFISGQNCNAFNKGARSIFGDDEVSICCDKDSAGINETTEEEILLSKTCKSQRNKTVIEDQPLLNATSGADDNRQVIPSHIQKKQLLEARRKEYKEGWLIPTESFQQLMNSDGKMIVPPNTPAACSILPPPVAQEKMVAEAVTFEPATTAVEKCDVAGAEVKLLEEAVEKLKLLEKSKDDRKLSNNSDDIEVLTSHFQESNDFEPFEEDCNANYSAATYGFSENSDSSENSVYESEGCLFPVEMLVNNKCQSLFVKIKGSYIQEMDMISGKIIDELDLRSLTFVDLYKNAETQCHLRLAFDTMKTNRQKRIYVLENIGSAQTMYVKLKAFAEAKVLADVVTGALQCLKCSSAFSKEVAEKKIIKGNQCENTIAAGDKSFIKETSACPNCGSTIVVETETMPLPSVPLPECPERKPVMQHSKNKSQSKPGLDSIYLSSAVYSGLESVPYKSEITASLKRKRTGAAKNDNEDVKDTVDTDSKMNVSNFSAKLYEQMGESESFVAQRTRQSFSHSNLSSSITVISDTESTLDITAEQVSVPTLLPSSPTQLSNENTNSLQQICRLENSTFPGVTATTTEISFTNAQESRKISTSVTESLNNEHSINFYISGKELELNDLRNNSFSTENVNLISLFQGKEQFSCETFTSIDHRLKLHLEVGVFDNDEVLLACLQAGVVPLTNGIEFSGFLVISSKKLYIMSYQEDFSERFEKSVKQVLACPLKQLKVVRTLLGSQGVSITCGSEKVFVFLVRDADLCNCFTSHLLDITSERLLETELPQFIVDAEESLAQVNSQIISVYPSENGVEEESEILLHLFGYWSVEGKHNQKSVCFIVTPTSIFVADVKFKKLVKQSERSSLFYYVPLEKQKIVDLMEVKLKEDLFCAEILFKDEEKNIVTKWIVSTQTKSSLFSFISAFKTPWDGIFGIDLPLSLVA